MKRVGERYEILEEVGRGGMGVVYRARDTKLDRIVALKSLSTATPEDLARFQREARTAARLRHPHIVPVHDIEMLDGEWFLSMGHVDGSSLLHAKLSPREIMEAGAQIAAALGAAHKAGVVHRDVKPENILIDGKGRAHLADFGLARSLTEATVTQTGAILGTPAYMSPEQARGLPADERTDVYSLGATLYHLLTGREPFAAPTTMELLRRIGEEDPPVPKGVDRDLGAILMKCLEKDTERRYANGSDLAEDINRHLRGEPVQAASHGILRRALRRLGRRKALAVTASIAVVVIGALIFRGWVDAAARTEARSILAIGKRRVDSLRIARGQGKIVIELRRLAERAVEKLEEALAVHPGLPDAWLEMGRAWYYAYEEEKALDCFNRAIEIESRFVPAYLERLKVVLEQYEDDRHSGGEGDPEMRARIDADVKQVEKYAGRDEERLYARAMLLLADGRFREGTALLTEYLKIAPWDDRAHYWRAHTLVHLGDLEDAISSFGDGIAANPWSFELFYERGRCWFKLKKYREADADFDRILRIWGDRVDAFYHRARIQLEFRDAARAIRFATRALAMDPDHVDSRIVRGTAYRANGDLQLALDDFNVAIRLAPDHSDARYNRGMVYLRRKEYDNAVTDFRKSLELGPESGAAAFGMGKAFFDRRILDQAVTWFQKSVRWRPDYAPGFYYLALTHDYRKEFSFAEENYTKAIAINPRDGQAYNNRGLIYKERKEWERAKDDFTSAIRTSPGIWQAWYNRANVRFLLKDYAGAISDCTEALRRRPDRSSILLLRADASLRAGDRASAARDARQALKMRLSAHDRAMAEAILKRAER